MSTKKNWAEESSDEGSVDGADDEQYKEDEPLVEPGLELYEDLPGNNNNLPSPGLPNTPGTYDSLVAYITNISYSCTEDDLGYFLSDVGCHVTSVNIRKSNTPGNKVVISATVEFRDAKSMDFCMKLNGQKFKGRELICKVWQPPANRFDSRGGGRGAGRGGQSDRGGFAHNDRSGPPGRKNDQHDGGDYNHHKSGGGGRGGDDYRDREYGNRGGGGRYGGVREGRDDYYNNNQRNSRGPMPSPGRGYSDAREGGIGGNRGGNKAAEAPPAPPTRPIINLLPRTLPIGESAAPAAPKPDIFGGAKPNDVIAFEVRKYLVYFLK